MVAAFDLGEFHRVFGRSSKILLLRRFCCLCEMRHLSVPGQRQLDGLISGLSAAFVKYGIFRLKDKGNQISLIQGFLLPLRDVASFGSRAKAARLALFRAFCCL